MGTPRRSNCRERETRIEWEWRITEKRNESGGFVEGFWAEGVEEDGIGNVYDGDAADEWD